MKPLDPAAEQHSLREASFDEQVAWSRNLFGSIADGGTWAVPRSGLIFNRQGDALVLTMRLPHDPDMPLTPAQLHEYQQGDYETIRRRFEAAGIIVRDTSAAPSVELRGAPPHREGGQ